MKVALIGARGHAGSRNPAELVSRGHKIKGSTMACEWGDKGNAQNHVRDLLRSSKRFEAFRFPDSQGTAQGHASEEDCRTQNA